MRNILVILICLLFLGTIAVEDETAPKTNRIIVPFVISNTGHIVMKAKINNKDACFVVDTAAGASVIHKKQVEYLGLKSGESLGEAQGLGTASHAMRNIDIPKMKIGKTQYMNPFFVVMDLSHVEHAADQGLHGLIGSPFLRKHGAIINYEKKTISLKLPKKSVNSNSEGRAEPDRR